jgi:xylan 1,4-beta-xylosidase
VLKTSSCSRGSDGADLGRRASRLGAVATAPGLCRYGLGALLALLLLVAPAGAATVSVDLSNREPVKLKIGFLHNLTDTAPSDVLLRPLRPTAWRGSEVSASRRRVRSLGAQHTVILSDLWSSAKWNWKPFYGDHNWGPPYTQLQHFGDWVRRIAQRFKRRGLLYWDIWNEPDHPAFWDGTKEDYFETFAVAERVLREELGRDARIVGPSTAAWRPDWIRGLAEFCRRRGCRVDVVDWHDLRNDIGSVSRLSERLGAARLLLGHRRVEFHISEMMGHGIQYSPGALVAYFSELEDGGADVAIKSCWDESSGRSNCDGQTLNGLLEWDGRPRAIWHTWRAYAEGQTTRVRSRSRDPQMAAIASKRSFVLGSVGSVRREGSVRLCGLGRVSDAALRIERHPNLGEAAFRPTPEWRRLQVGVHGRCAVGRIPLPTAGDALVAYPQLR